MPGGHGHIDMELRCSALLPLTEMCQAFEAAMDLVGDYEPAKGEIACRWKDAAEQLSQHFAHVPAPAKEAGAEHRFGPAAIAPGSPDWGPEWSRRVADCMSGPPVREALRAALERTAAYQLARAAFIGGVPDRYVREFLRRAVAELVE